MASDEHKVLASFIKKTHSDLRKESQIHGATEAWKRHISQHEVLQNYAASMQALATKHWAKHSTEPKRGVRCRIDWIEAQCGEYFFNGGKEQYCEKEMRIKRKMIFEQKEEGENILKTDIINVKTEILESDFHREHATAMCQRDIKSDDSECEVMRSLSKINLLDVGSCYNPLGEVNIFDVTAIDLIPFCDSVLQCDFLHLKVGVESIFSDDARRVIQLTANSFDAVVFSLLLEYLPCPEQRYACCKKAYDLLNDGGILVVVTPDSKHVGANARIMKSWRFILSQLGFMRIKYEKLPHVHCLIFRKCIYREVSRRWADVRVLSEDDILFQSRTKIYIPQDFQENLSESTEVKCREADVCDIDDVINIFKELPCTC